MWSWLVKMRPVLFFIISYLARGNLYKARKFFVLKLYCVIYKGGRICALGL